MLNYARSIVDILQKLNRLLSKSQKMIGIAVLALSIIGAGLELLGISIVMPLVDAIVAPENLRKNPIISNILKYLNIGENWVLILLVGGVAIIIYIFKNLYFIFLCWVRIKYACKVQRELAVDMMRAYMKRDYPFFVETNSGYLVRGVLNDTKGIYNILSSGLRMLVDILTVALICLFVCFTDWQMAFSMLLLATLCLGVIFLYFKKIMKKSGEEYRNSGTLVNQYVLQAFEGIKEILVVNRQNYFVRKFEYAYNRQLNSNIKQCVGNESPAYIIEGICVAGLLGAVCIRSAFGMIDPQTLLPVLSAFVMAAFRMLPSLGRISSGMNFITFYTFTLDEMYSNIQAVKNNHDFYVEGNYSCGKNYSLEQEIKIDNIYFRYNKASEDVLRGISFTIKKGEATAFIGQSGAGKTTLADIILGLLKPQKGKILIDGINIIDLGNQWRRIIGYVPQSIYLTDDLLRNNIAFGIDEKEIDDNKIWKALEQAQLKDFVENLDNQLNTRVGERGIRFSGGQRQRIAIARALYEDPDIIIFDEATAALDHETELAVMDSIDALHGSKTLIIIAHRLSTIKNCDKIYEIAKGKAVLKSYDQLNFNIS